MLKKELITQQEHDILLPNVQVVGPAKELILPTDTVLVEEEEIF